ncbi:6549_t:CDS:1, partial [Funneliformis caledonium]
KPTGNSPNLKVPLNQLEQSKSTTNISKYDELSSQLWIKDFIKKKFITEIKWNDLVGKSPVGSGKFEVVYKTHWKKMNKDVVCKRQILDDINAIEHEIKLQIRGH